MIPTVASDLDALAGEVERQRTEVAEILTGHSAEDLTWRPSPRNWSVLGHVAHLCLIDEPYTETMEGVVERARAAGGPLSDGPYRHPWFGSWFARSMEPPPKRRFKTMKSMVPDPVIDGGEVSERYAAAHGRLAGLIESARGLDLGKLRFSSPFMVLVRLSLGTGMELLLAHNRRHIWLIREVLEARGLGE